MAKYRLRGPKGGNMGTVPYGRGFVYKDVHYPRNWISRGGQLPGVATIELEGDAPPPPQPAPAVYPVALNQIKDRLDDTGWASFAAGLETLPAERKWEIIVSGSVNNTDADIRVLLNDPDVTLRWRD